MSGLSFMKLKLGKWWLSIKLKLNNSFPMKGWNFEVKNLKSKLFI